MTSAWQFSYKTWRWTEQYPGSDELQAYFKHIDQCLDISKDTLFNTRVVKAVWSEDGHYWDIECDTGVRITANFLHCCIGFAAKRYFPDWPGLKAFKGYVCHSSFWPAKEVDMKGKKVGVVGTGATGVQIAQTVAREAGQLKVFVRTSNTAMPMNQGAVSPEQAEKDLQHMERWLRHDRLQNYGGFLYEGTGREILKDSPELQESTMNEAFDQGGFRPLFQYTDYLTNAEANRRVYDIWAQRTRRRMADSVKRDILIPLEPPHFFAAKRNSLEQDYYEQMDRPHVTLVDLKQHSVSHVVSEGIVMDDGTLHELDVLALATGFDSLTGGFAEIDIRGMHGEKLSDHWGTQRGVLSYLGLAVAGFPNMM